MSEKSFSINESLNFGWEAMKNNIGFFIALLIIAFLIENIPGVIAGFVKTDFPFISALLYLAGWLLGFIVQMGLIKVSLKACDGIKGQLDDLLSSFNLLITFIASSILYGLIIVGGTILFIVPGIIWGVKFSLFPYFIVDEGLGPVEALQASSRATSGAKFHLFLFGLLLGLINFAGALLLMIGLFITIPTSLIAYAYAYRTLAEKVTGTKAAPTDSMQSPMYINLGI